MKSDLGKELPVNEKLAPQLELRLCELGDIWARRHTQALRERRDKDRKAPRVSENTMRELHDLDAQKLQRRCAVCV